jgi:predicted NUDIX family NTP pyrophosphohydrolase
MAKQSAGLMVYRGSRGSIEVLLVHPGGPFWANKDDAAWSIPKGELKEGEDPLEGAKREFQEETSLTAEGKFQPVNPVRQKGGKIVHAWAIRSDFDAATVKSNTFSLKWPPASGMVRQFPEIDRAEWFPIRIAKRKILKGQLDLLAQLEKLLGEDP